MNYLKSENVRQFSSEEKVVNAVIEQTIRSVSNRWLTEEQECLVCKLCGLGVEQRIPLSEHNCIDSLKGELLRQKSFIKRVVMRIRSLWFNETNDLFQRQQTSAERNRLLNREIQSLKTRLVKQKLFFHTRVRTLRTENQLLKNRRTNKNSNNNSLKRGDSMGSNSDSEEVKFKFMAMEMIRRQNQLFPSITDSHTNDDQKNTREEYSENELLLNDSSDSIEVIHESINNRNVVHNGNHRNNENLDQNNNDIIIRNNNTNSSGFWRPFETHSSPEVNATVNSGPKERIYKPVPIYAFPVNGFPTLAHTSINTQYQSLNQSEQQLVYRTTIPNHLCGNTLFNTNGSVYIARPILPQPEPVGAKQPAQPVREESVIKTLLTKNNRQEKAKPATNGRKGLLVCEQKNCGKVFRFRSALENHRLVHSTEKKFSCKECGKKYKQMSGLYSHESTKHSSNKKAFVCQFCAESFVDYRNLKIHEYNQHKSTDSVDNIIITGGQQQSPIDDQKKKVYLQLRKMDSQMK